MNQNSRMKNSLRNAITGVIGQIIIIILNFFTRTVFIKYLSVEYLGINGLFTNLLTMLSLAELGIGTAMIYSMYKPLAEQDEETLKGLMCLYARAYQTIAVVIAIIGLMLVPYLHIFIGDNIEFPDIKLIYILFLSNTVISYLFSYKRSIISADQKEYINSKYRYRVAVCKSIIQIILLVIYRNFIVYLMVQMICTFLENYLISKQADKLYPFLKKKEYIKLPKKKTAEIITNIKALTLYKICSVILDGTDNIIISSFVGVYWVGLLSNYTLIIGSLSMVVSQVLNAVTASIGNLVAKDGEDRQEFIFNVLFFVSFWIYAFCSICLFVLINPFIKLWIGEQYLLSEITVLVIVLNFYIFGMQSAAWTYRSTMGLFKYGKWRPLISAIINLVISIMLAQYIGVLGVLLGTTVTRVTTNVWYDPLIIFKYGFNKSIVSYYIKYLVYLIILILIGCLTVVVNSIVDDGTIMKFIIMMGICTVIPNLLLGMIFNRSKEFRYLYQVIKRQYLRR